MSEHDDLDRLLSETLAAPVPALPAAFDRRVLARTRPRRLDRRGVWLLAAYAAFGVIASVWAMREASMGWGTIAASMGAPLLAGALALMAVRLPLRGRAGATARPARP